MLGLSFAIAAHAQAPTENLKDDDTNTPIQGDVIIKPNPPSEPTPTPKPKVTVPKKGTDLKNAHPIDAEKLRVFLKNSPLASHTEQLVKSDFTALIIGICWIEQYSCTRAPGNNYWGMMKLGGERAGLRVFASLPEAITYMDGYFTRLYPRRSTVESLRQYYCVGPCTNWEPTVLRIKREIEAL